MNNSRRKFLEKGPAVAAAAAVGVASGKITMASPPTPNDGNDGTRPLLNTVIENQSKINGKLYAANELLLKVLNMAIPHVPGIDVAAAMAELNQAEGYIDQVPGDKPPGCTLPGGYS